MSESRNRPIVIVQIIDDLRYAETTAIVKYPKTVHLFEKGYVCSISVIFLLNCVVGLAFISSGAI